MQFLIDNSKIDARYPELVAGQLLTPLTKYRNWSPACFAIDNGAFSGFRNRCFSNVLNRQEPSKAGCLFVCVPDVVGNARRTLEIWRQRFDLVSADWPLALVAQDGLENLEIPWPELACIFIGGTDSFKSSDAAMDIVRTARILKKHVHIGRVNSPSRYRRFKDVAETCDGSGVSRGLGNHLQSIAGDQQQSDLFD